MPSVACCSTSFGSSFGFATSTALSASANFAKSDCGLFVNVGLVTCGDGSFIFTSSVATASIAAFRSWLELGLSTCRSMRMLNAASAVGKVVDAWRGIGSSWIAVQEEIRSPITRNRAGRKWVIVVQVYERERDADAGS